MSHRVLAGLCLLTLLACTEEVRREAGSPTEPPSPAPTLAVGAAATLPMQQSSVCRALMKARTDTKLVADSTLSVALQRNVDQLDAAVADVCN